MDPHQNHLQLKDNMQATRKPHGTRVAMLQTDSSIRIMLPVKGWIPLHLVSLVIALVWMAGGAMGMAVVVEGMARRGDAAGVITLLASSCFLATGAGILWILVGASHNSQVLHIGTDKYGVWDELNFWDKASNRQFEREPDAAQLFGDTSKLTCAELVTRESCNPREDYAGVEFIRIREGSRENEFGNGLSTPELAWIVEEVNKKIKQIKNSNDF